VEGHTEGDTHIKHIWNDTLAATDPKQRGIRVPLGATVGGHTSGGASAVLGIEAMVYSYVCMGSSVKSGV